MKNINDLIKRYMEEVVKIADKIITSSESNNDSINVFVYYSTTPLGDIARIFMSIVILICLFNIVVVYYVDYLLVYFKLKGKYPRLAKWIIKNKKHQQYYILLNVFIIFVISMFELYVELTILKYGG